MRPQPPFFSVIIPTYARPRLLDGCLHSLTRLDYPRSRFEVIVVDDGGDVSLEPMLDRFRSQLDVKLLRQAHLGPAAARNTGAAAACGRYLAFTDDDCRPEKNWLRALAERFTAAPRAAVGGPTLNARPENLFASASLMLIRHLVHYPQRGTPRLWFLSTSNLAVPADQFRRMGGFDTRAFAFVSEDRDFCDRWQHCGYEIVYAPEAIVHHVDMLTLHAFCRQQFNYGRGSYRFRKERAARRAEPLRIADLKFYINSFHYPFQHSQGVRAWQLFAALLLARLANATGFLWEAVAAELRSQ